MTEQREYDVCVIGSGAGGGPIAWTLAGAGFSVLVLEKGPWIHNNEFFKDELACCRREVYTPPLSQEQHVIEDRDGDGGDDGWTATPTAESGWNFWNGNCVGGATNFMSGFFHRLQPVDFRLWSEFGPIAGANVADWPIDYAALEPYYDQVERVIGVSGNTAGHTPKGTGPRSRPNFPYPPTREHPIAEWIDASCRTLGYHAQPVPRAILPTARGQRGGCSYSGYCGSYGCATGAKGSSRAALLDAAVAGGHCEVRPQAQVVRLDSDATGQVSGVQYIDSEGNRHTVRARLYVVAAQAIETTRLLLNSTGPRHPDGLGNRHDQVGRNLLFSAGGSGSADFHYDDLAPERAAGLAKVGPFVNRALHDWYVVDDAPFSAPIPGGRGPAKGGIIEFLFEHPNPVSVAGGARRQSGQLLWGAPLKRRLETWFRGLRTLNFEVFCDWLPNDDCFVALDPSVKDRWGQPVARVRIGHHPHDLVVGRYLAERGERVLAQMGGRGVRSSISGSPPPNLVAGGCRFGNDPRTSVLNADCRIHDVDNVYVSDGSFMPSGGSVPYTWTIYANAFRVADILRQRLGTPSR